VRGPLGSHDLRNAACEMADRGYAVLPIKPSSKAPLVSLVRHGKDDATSNLAVVLGWWLKRPDANIAIACHASNLVVIDVDDRSGGYETFADLERKLGKLLPTVSVASGGGGVHYYFTHPGGVLKGSLGPGVDIKDHGYVLAPPSRHDSGGAYIWDNDIAEVAVADLPRAWRDALKSGVSRKIFSGTPDQDHTDPLRRIPAVEYIARLTGREVQRGDVFVCPFHAEGREWDPSLKASGTVWSCHGCPSVLGKRAMGGNIYDFAGLLAGYAIPPKGADYMDIRERLRRVFRI